MGDFSQIYVNKYGFNYIWISQNVDNKEIFLNVFKSRIKSTMSMREKIKKRKREKIK